MISSRPLKIALWSLPAGVVGIFTGFASGAVGICGNGGWGIVPFFGGLAALVVSAISFVIWIASLIARCIDSR